jgi:hypothetical protein
MIYLFGSELGDEYVEWQHELGFAQWNVYKGSLTVLRTTGVYTQVPGSNPLASRFCRLDNPWYRDLTAQPAGTAAFYLVTGLNGSVESSLGTNSAGTTRPNTSPCP